MAHQTSSRPCQSVHCDTATFVDSKSYKRHVKCSLQRWNNMKVARLTLMMLIASAGAWAGRHPKIAKDLAIDTPTNVDVIIQFNDAPTAAHHDRVRAHGGGLKVDLHAARAALYSVPAS